MKRWVAFAFLAACGGNGGGDGTVDAPPNPDAQTGIAIDRPAGGTVHLLSLRWDDGSWTALPLDAKQFPIGGTRYQLASVCSVSSVGSNTVFWTNVYGNAVSDGNHVGLPCTDYVNPTDGVYTISGQMAEAGSAYIGNSHASGTTSPWTYALSTQNKTFDLLALTDTKVAIRRDVTVTGDTTLDPVSVVAGEVLGALTFTLDAGTDSTRVVTSLIGRNGPVAIIRHDSTLTTPVVPMDLMRTDDIQTCSALVTHTSANGDMLLRSVKVSPVPGATTSFTLPTFPSPFTQTTTGFEFSSPLDADQVYTSNDSYFMEVTRAWLENATKFEIDVSELPGYDATWPMTYDNKQIYISKALPGTGAPEQSLAFIQAPPAP